MWSFLVLGQHNWLCGGEDVRFINWNEQKKCEQQEDTHIPLKSDEDSEPGSISESDDEGFMLSKGEGMVAEEDFIYDEDGTSSFAKRASCFQNCPEEKQWRLGVVFTSTSENTQVRIIEMQ